MDILQSILGFVLAIGVLVAFHEFGHYWVAKKLGVKVLRYSIGFGKPLVSWRRGKDRTEYVIAAIPLGGYVKMLDEREGEVAAGELHRAFNRKPLWVRTLVVAAGPVFNFIFAIAAYWFIFVWGTMELKPVVGEVLPGTPAAAAGFDSGDQLLSVAGDPARTWDQVLIALLDAGVDRERVPVEVLTEQGSVRIKELDLKGILALGEEPDYLKVVGLRPWIPVVPPIIDEVMAGSAAAQAGIEPGARVVTIDGHSIKEWTQLVDYVSERPNQAVDLTVETAGQLRELDVMLQARDRDGKQVGSLGVLPRVPEGLYQNMSQEVRYGPLEAIQQSIKATWNASMLTLKVLWQMVLGNASLKNLSGPITIAQYAGDSVSLGMVPFLKFLAIVSISLGVLNLLPVPVLDGGHLLYFGIEGIRGRPLSEKAQVVGQQIGMALLFLLMTIALYNDITRQ